MKAEEAEAAAVAAAATQAKKAESDEIVNLLLAVEASTRLQRNGKALIDTKRADQNRKAQRAFRQRKEQYVKELQERVAGVKDLEAEIASLKAENQSLRNYILSLQSKLISDVPAPIDLKK